MSSAAKKGKTKGKKGGAAKAAKKDPKAARASAKGKKGGKTKAAKKDPKAAKKGTKGKAGKGKAAPKKDTKSKAASKAKPAAVEDSKQPDEPKQDYSTSHMPSPSKAVNTGRDIVLPETKEFVNPVPAQTVTPLMEDDNVATLQAQFEDFERLLRQRKKDCLTRARTLVLLHEGEDTPPVCIDIAGMKALINGLGLAKGERDYDVLVRQGAVLDKGNELLAYEAKHRGVTKTRERTTKEAIEEDIAECKAALTAAEPVLQASKDALKSITKASLDEIRALPKPHKLLVRTVKACAIMVGKKESELDTWGNIKKLLKTTFVNNLLEFEARNITAGQRKILESSDYLGKDGVEDADQLTYENVNKANGVAGCLVKWLEAQLKYNEMLPLVEPELLRLADLQVDLLSIDGKIEKLDNALAELDRRIERSKGELRGNGRAYNTARSAQNACE